jgi:hypothetical protein
MIESRLLMRLGAAASIIGHMVLLTLGIMFADAHPYESKPSEAIAIDIVAPEEARALPKPAEPAKPEPKRPDPIDFSALAPPKPQASVEPPRQQAPQQKSQAAATPASRSPPPGAQPATGAQQDVKPQGAETAQQAAAQPPPVPQAPEPDITVKYGVMLGLPSSGRDFSGVEAPAFDLAKLNAEDIAAFRRHLKTCSSLPASVAPTDKVRIVLRVLLSRNGRLATEPALIEASASAKGPVLMQQAIGALQACQPYAMLPADKYNEWKVLDLSFTPQDFAPG